MTARKARRRPQPAIVDSRAMLDAEVKEEGKEGLRAAVTLLLVALGYRVHHCHDSRLCGPDEGMPDLIAVGFGRVLFIELKTQTGKKRRGQYLWAYELERGPAEYYLWRPRDWSSGLIERVLKAHLAATWGV